MVCVSVVTAAGCTPNCESSCKKVLDCGLDSQRFSLIECEQACIVQQTVYEQWENDELVDAFKDHRRCLSDASCDEIAAGECYDERLFTFDDGDRSVVR